MLNESITALIKSEPKSDASRQARKMGLKYVGFGRYADHTGNVAYIVVKDKLVPFKKDEELAKMMRKAADEETKRLLTPPKKGTPVKKNTGPTLSDVKRLDAARNQRSLEDRRIIKEKNKEIEALDKELTSFYGGIFNDDELKAIELYTGEDFEDINRYLYRGYDEGTDYFASKYIEDIVSKLDAAFEETEAPFKYTTYTGLSDRYNPESFEVGREYIFKGYVSSSLDHNIAGDTFTGFKKDKKAKSKTSQGVVLELEIPKGAKSIYLEPHTSQKSSIKAFREYETLLPRGTKIKVVSGPHKVETTTILPNARSWTDAGNPNNTLVIFKCKVVKEEV
jgi:ADP-ribosyltransferase exoenzyme